MLRYAYVGGLAVFLIVWLVSCDDQPTSPPQNFPDVSVQISGLDSAIVALEGDLCASALEIYVTDENDEPVSEVPVKLWVDSGPGETAFQNSESDSAGIVQAIYYVTVPFGDTSAVIKATAGYDTSSTVIALTGEPTPAILQLSANPPILSTRLNQSTQGTITAQLLDRRGNGVSDIIVAFSLLSGEAQFGDIIATDSSGRATTTITVNGTWFGDLIVAASVVDGADQMSQLPQDTEDFQQKLLQFQTDRDLIGLLRTLSLSVDNDPLTAQMTIPVECSGGRPILLKGWAEPDETDHPTRMFIYHVQCLDDSGQGVPYQRVDFSTTIGWFARSHVITDQDGYGETEIHWDGVIGGNAQVTMIWEGSMAAQTSLRFIIGPPYSIEVSHPDTVYPGINGHRPVDVGVTVRDKKGRPVAERTPVMFELLGENDHYLRNYLRSDTSSTRDGTAWMLVDVGLSFKPIQLRVTTWKQPDYQDPISVITEPILVIGDPVSLDLDVDYRGVDVGDSLWALELSAGVFDRNNHPVQDGWLVRFSVEPDIVEITSYGVVGNTGLRSDPAPGTAYCTLTYNSENTFDTVTVVAWCYDLFAIRRETAIRFALPLQEGCLELYADPQNWIWDRENVDDTLESRVWAVLTDGHQVLINNAPILFTASRGRFYYRVSDQFRPYYPDPARALTPDAEVWLRASYWDLWDLWLEVTVQIQAVVEGYDDTAADPVFIFVTRH